MFISRRAKTLQELTRERVKNAHLEVIKQRCIHSFGMMQSKLAKASIKQLIILHFDWKKSIKIRMLLVHHLTFVYFDYAI